MELMALIIALESLTKKDIPVVVFTDSKYLVDSITKKWVDGWIRNNFAGGKKNKDLWLRYVKAAKGLQIQYNWVKGHADNPLNNRCDELATAAADGANLLVDEEFERNN